MATQSRPGLPRHADKPMRDSLEGDPGHSDDLEKSFLSALLAVVSASGPADAGVVFAYEGEGSATPLALYPATASGKILPSWLAQAAALNVQSISTDGSVCVTLADPNALYEVITTRYIISAPLKLPGLASHTVAFLTRSVEEKAAQAIQRRIELSIFVLHASAILGNMTVGDAAARPLRQAVDSLVAFDPHRPSGRAAMPLANAVPPKWHCERASIGFLKGSSVHVRTIRHTADFSRQSQIVKTLDAAV